MHVQAPAARHHDAGVRAPEGSGPSRSFWLGMNSGFAQGRWGANSSEWEAIVLTQPVVLCSRTALAAVSAQSILQQPQLDDQAPQGTECPGGEPGGGLPPTPRALLLSAAT